MENIREVKLEKFRYVLLSTFAEEQFDELANKPEIEMTDHAGFMADDLTIRVKGFVAAETLDEKTVTYPADWWQAFKLRWFPQWLIKRYPVKMEVYEFVARALYPKISIPDSPSILHMNVNHEIDYKGKPEERDT